MERRAEFKSRFRDYCEVAGIRPIQIQDKKRIWDLYIEYNSTGDEDVFKELYNCVWRERESLALRVQKFVAISNRLRKASGGSRK